MSAGPNVLPHTAVRGRVAAHNVRRLVFPLLLLGALVVYLGLRAPVLDSPGYLDPWIYTATMINSNFIFHTFGWAYYPSRLPWVIPGIAVHSVLSPLPAFFVLHIAFFTAAGAAIFFLTRSYFGIGPACVSFATVALCPIYYDAFTNDYPDGAVITFLLLASYFGFTAAADARWRVARVAAAGFFAAAAVGTNLFAAALVLGIGAACGYVAGWRQFRQRANDLAAAAGGAFLLLLACGLFSRSHGGEFLFFMPQWRFARSSSTAAWKLHGYDWLWREPQLLIPFVVLVSLLLLLRTIRRDLADNDFQKRYAVAVIAVLAYYVGMLTLWEFAFSGNFFDLPYYFSLFMVPTALALGPIIFALQARGRLLAVALAAAAAPVVAVYGVHLLPTGTRAASTLAVALFAAALVTIAIRVGRIALVSSVAVLIMLVGAVNYAAAAGLQTKQVFLNGRANFEHNHRALLLATQLIDWMRRNGLQESEPTFWYNGYTNPDLMGIQSTYLWGDTWIGLQMPKLDGATKRTLDQRAPGRLVLICGSPTCGGAVQVLRKRDYRPRVSARGVIASGGERYWLRAVTIPRFASLTPDERFYVRSQSRLGIPARGIFVRQWSFATSLRGWSGTAASAPRPAGAVTTSTRPWNYELVSPHLTLPPGRYELALRGRVTKGGLDLGIENASNGAWIEQSLYWSKQLGFDREWMITRFTLTSTTNVEAVLSNWVPHEAASRWQLTELRLIRRR